MSEFKPGQSMNEFGGHAFPLNVEPINAIQYGGMSLRDYFAAKALQGMLSASEIQLVIGKGINISDIAGACYEWADQMLKARINQGEKA